ncbi:GNAT family N-acetyltransferase [Brevibacterium sediminis]|uniref:GNAT family N-acetyltransferase n=1 Tax=Brevibacterium sediminis TaxID=1857024 RepID=UPI002175164F|nr:GNAT family N-acetyltransferase [Brevibacterium sediminis]MCS4591622.1 GNAT family N-acetyltransferase [Brevibacterium sediminis]
MLTPTTTDLPDIIDTVASWQREGLPVQVHPGDLGWYQRFGADALASALRVWTVGDEPAAVGFLDESELIRMAVSPDYADDRALAEAILADLNGDLSELLPAGKGIVEARFGSALQNTLTEAGWGSDEPWTQLSRALEASVPPVPLRIEAVTADLVDDRISVEAAAFPGSSLTRERWEQMAGGYACRQARCLIGYAEGEAVGATTVWSAGRGRPGLIEPLGVDAAHRGHGFGVAIAEAAAATLRAMGASSVTVATPSSNTAAVAAYKAAGMDSLGEVTDFRRP